MFLSYAVDKQTDKQTDSKILPTPTDIVGVGNKYYNETKRTTQAFDMYCRHD